MNTGPGIHLGISSGISRVGLRGGGVSECHKCEWLVRVGASNGVHLLVKKVWPEGGGVSGQPEKKPGYATGQCCMLNT